jgi:hypothetical protein
MDRRQIGLKLALDALGRELRLIEFDDRLILQKTVYLLQAAGVRLGYSFSWYHRGPYSSTLTRDAFAIVAESMQGTDDASGWKLDPGSQSILARLRPLFDPARPNLADDLELFASVHFLRCSHEGQGKDAPALQEVLRRNGKGQYTADDVRRATEELTRHGFAAGPA